MDHPRRACTSRKGPLQDLADDDFSRSDSDASWGVNSADASVSSASVDDSSPSDTSESRTSSDHSAGGGYSVTCPDLSKTEFESWDDFHGYLDLYQKEAFQVNNAHIIRMYSLNKQIDSAKKSSSEIIPPDWGTYAKTIICTHGGKHRYRGKGKRPRQEVRPMGCMTQINVCVQLVSEQPSKFAVCVSKTALTHNHKLGLRSYEHYAANRMSVNGEVLETVDSLWKAGAKTKSILKFIVENSDSNPTPQDAQNLIRNLKKRAQGGMTRSHRIKSGCWTFARFLATWVVYLWTRPTKRESQLALRSKRNTLWIYSTDS
ncbi:hypothetical protein L915_14823, partial [Phytophthora nicotianae]